MTKTKFVEEAVKIWVDICLTVYLFDKNKLHMDEITKDFEFVFDHTTYSPFGAACYFADPTHFTNQVVFGQKARVKRWKKWLVRNEVSKYSDRKLG